MKLNPSLIAKALTALAGAGAEILNLSLASGDTAKWLGIAVSVATTVAVYLVPNKGVSQ